MHYSSLSAMFNSLHSISNQELFEKHLCNPRISKEIVPCAPGYINYYRLKSEVSITLRCWLMFNPLHSSTNQELFEKRLCYQNSHYDKYGRFLLRREAIAKSTLFTVSKDEWDTKKDTCKSMKKALHVLRYAKRHQSGQSDVEQ